MFKNGKKLIALALSAALAFTAAAVTVPTVEAEAASTQKVYVTTKTVDDEGTVTKYKYNSWGLVSQVISTNSTVDKDTKAVTGSSTSNTPSTSTSDGVTTTTTTGSYDIYGYVTTTDSHKEKSTSDITYYKKGVRKGKIKKVVKTTVISGTVSSQVTTIKDSTGTYAADNSYSFSYTKTITSTTVYKYSDGVLSTSVTTTTTPDYYTYSNVTGKINGSTLVPETVTDVTQNKYLNTSNYANDNTVTTVTSTYTTTNDKIKKVSASREVVENDYNTLVVTSGSDTTTYNTTVTTTSTYDPVVYKYKYNKKGYVKKLTVKDPETGSKVVKTVVTTSKSGSSLTDTDTETLTTPIRNESSKAVTTYTYDSNKNLASKTTTNTYTDYTAISWTSTVAESSTDATSTSGATSTTNTTDANSEYLSIKQSTEGTTTYDVTLKSGSTRISTRYATSTANLKSGEKDKSTSTIKTVMTVKKKKIRKSFASKVEAQQWSISNGMRNLSSWGLI